MDWVSLQEGMPRDPDLPARAARLQALTAVLEGRHYDHLVHPFSEEVSPAGEYVPLDKRRPSVRSNLCRVVVDDAVSLLFSDGHLPSAKTGVPATDAALADLAKHARLGAVLTEAATRGSVGSAAILFRVLKGKPHLRTLPTAHLTPAWDPEDPDALVSVTERYKVRAADLVAQGYAVDPLAGAHWFQRVWDRESETWFLPWPVRPADGKPAVPQVDAERTVRHGLGFVPVVWVRNLPGGDDVDGECTFRAAIDTVIAIDYQLSQGGRALRAAGDPKLVVRDPSGRDGPIVGGAANAIVLSDPQAEAKFLEINGAAAGAVLDYVRYLRGVALEAVHGNRADADKLSAAQSGRAMELMNQGLIWLADKLRTSYGEGALISILRMACEASRRLKTGLVLGDTVYRDLECPGVTLTWPRWYAPTAADRQADAATLATLRGAGLISQQTAIENVAADYDIEDVAAEQEQILRDLKQPGGPMPAGTQDGKD